jgi:hypothetical protein
VRRIAAWIKDIRPDVITARKHRITVDIVMS